MFSNFTIFIVALLGVVLLQVLVFVQFIVHSSATFRWVGHCCVGRFLTFLERLELSLIVFSNYFAGLICLALMCFMQSLVY